MSPDRKPFLSAFAEDIGIEPNTRRYISLSRRTLSPSRFIFRSAHDGLRSHYLLCIRQVLYQLSYMSGCGQGRTRTFNHSINSRGLCHWATCPFFCGRGGTRTPKAFATDLQSAEPTNCSTLPYCTPYRDRTCDLLYVRQPLLPSELRVLVLVFLYKSNHFLVTIAKFY